VVARGGPRPLQRAARRDAALAHGGDNPGVAEDPFWRSVRLTYEELDEDCPTGHRTVALAHLANGDKLEVNRVRPYRDGWVWLQSDYTEQETPEVNFIRDNAIYRVELKHIRDMRERKKIGFIVERLTADEPT
jgi:hypothetical protein